jgi:hypothetical protein
VWFNAGNGLIALGLVARRRGGLRVALRCAARRIHQTLRQGRGLTYATEVVDDALDEHLFHGVLLADCMDQHAGAVSEGLVAAVDGVATSGPTDAEMRGEHSAFLREHRDPEWAYAWLDFLAMRHLNGQDAMTREEYVTQVMGVDAHAARDALAEALVQGILLLPDGVVGPSAPWVILPEADDEPVDGHLFRPKGLARFRNDERLVIGDEGISLYGGGTWLTIPWERVACVLDVDETQTYHVVDREGGGLNVVLSAIGQRQEVEALFRRYLPARTFIPIRGDT